MSKPRKVIRTKRIYKKRRGKSKALSTIAFLVFLCALVGFGYIVSSEWSKRFGPNAPTSSFDISSGIISKPTADVSSEESSEPDEKDTLDNIKAAYLPANQLAQYSADQFQSVISQIKADGYNAVYVQLKTEDGKIYYNTQNESAKKFQAIAENPVDLNVLVKAIKDAGLKPIAQMSALKDSIAPHVKNENSYAYSTFLDTNWLDNAFDKGGKPWLNPYMEKARSYICDLTKEVSSAGFEVVVLDNVMFPDKNTSQMNTIHETVSRPQILKQLLDEAQTAAGDAIVLQGVNIETFANVNAAGYQNNVSAIGFANLAPNIDMDVIRARLADVKAGTQVEGTDTDVVKALLQKLQTSKEAKLMPVIKKADVTALEPILKELNIENYIII